jgi:thioredoxin 2
MTSEPLLLRCTSCNTLNRIPADKLVSHPHCGQCKAVLTYPNAPLTATAATFDREISSWPGFVLVEFWAKWCGFCQMIEPVVNDMARWKAGRLKVIKIEVDVEPVLAGRFAMRATPTFLFYRNGREIGRMDGAPREKIEFVQWVERLMA